MQGFSSSTPYHFSAERISYRNSALGTESENYADARSQTTIRNIFQASRKSLRRREFIYSVCIQEKKTNKIVLRRRLSRRESNAYKRDFSFRPDFLIQILVSLASAINIDLAVFLTYNYALVLMLDLRICWCVNNLRNLFYDPFRAQRFVIQFNSCALLSLSCNGCLTGE